MKRMLRWLQTILFAASVLLTGTVTAYAAPTVTLQADATSLTANQPVTLTASTSSLPSGDALVIENQTYGYNVGPGTNTDLTYTGQDSHTSGTMSFVAKIISPTTGDVAVSAPVTVTWNGTPGPGTPQTNYTVSCSSNGDGSAILTEYQNGTQVGTAYIPMTVGTFEVAGMYAPPLEQMQAQHSQTFIPTSSFPVYVRPFGSFSTRVLVTAPGHWPVDVKETATLTPPANAVDPSTGQTLQPLTWTVTAKPVGTNQNLFVAAFGLPKAYPDESTISLSISITDACGGQSISIPLLAVLKDEPVWKLTTLVDSHYGG